MKYSLKCLKTALIKVLPGSDTWPESIRIPTRMNIAATQMFMYPDTLDSRDTYDRGLAQLVIREAMVELDTIAEMRFGEQDYWK